MKYFIRVIFLISVLIAILTPVMVRADPHSNFELDMGMYDYTYVQGTEYDGDGIYGDFEVTYPASGDDRGIAFFICDEENFNLWVTGQPSVGYHNQADVESYSFSFRIPYTDTWYYVFMNFALTTDKTIQLDLYRDTTPPDIIMELVAGATYSGTKVIAATIIEETFSIDEVKLYIDGSLKVTGYGSLFSYSWDTTQYSNGAHTVIILASDNVGNSGHEEVIVQVSNEILPTDGGGLGSIANDPLFLGLFGLVAVVALVVIILRRRKGSPPVGAIPSIPPISPSEMQGM